MSAVVSYKVHRHVKYSTPQEFYPYGSHITPICGDGAEARMFKYILDIQDMQEMIVGWGTFSSSRIHQIAGIILPMEKA
jgi:hypothetical protein